MKVLRRLNNNVILAEDNLQEVVLMGKGIGFKVYPEELVKEELVEQKFIPSNSFTIESLAELLCSSNSEEIEIVKEIINYGEDILNCSLSDSLLVALLDHLHYALIRHKQNMSSKSPIEWEIRQIYCTEMTIGEKALSIIFDKTGIQLPESEATFIALHFINAQFDKESMSDTMDFSETMNQVNSIIKYHFQIQLDEHSINYQRFLTHLRYYLIRQKNREPLRLENEDLYINMKEKYPEVDRCIEKISSFIKKKYNWKTSSDEKLYLILHVKRLIA